MRQRAIVSLLSAVALLSGCGGQLPKLNGVLPPTTQQPTQQPPAQAPTQAPAPEVRGNWEFDATSNVAGNSHLRFAGDVSTETDPSKLSANFSGALHVDGSNCFDRAMTATFNGSSTADSGSVTITSADGQVVTFTGVFAATSSNGVSSNMTFTGTYSISGGCASGDQGKVTGINIPDSDLNFYPWFGVFTSSAQNTFDAVTSDGYDGLNVTATAGSDGVFGLSGTIATQSPCFSQGNITPGTFPSGSFILGKSVLLEAQAGDSVLTIEGTLTDDGGGINGTYTISGGSCTDSGTVYLYADPWGY